MPIPQAVAKQFVDAVDAGNAAAAWQLLDPGYRRVLAERWYDDHASTPALRGRDRPANIQAIVAGDDAWADLFEIYRLEFSALWPREHADWGWSDRVRPTDLGVDLVLFTDAEILRLQREAVGPDIPEVAVPAVQFYMRCLNIREGTDWLIASINEEPPTT